jgi:ParB-like chromosome segregation protein Spo0J
MKTINIQSIIIDKGTQSRAQISEDTVSEYAEAMHDGSQFPPVTVFFDGVDYYLADGFHRLLAVKRLAKTSITANVESGTLRDAILFSLSANNDHGLRRSNADKRKCVETLLDDFEWQAMSTREIASRCHVSGQLVEAVKAGRAKGEQVSSTVTNSKKKLNTVVEAPVEEEPAAKFNEAVQELVAENQRLSDRLSVEAIDATDEEKLAAAQTISQLREQVKILEVELSSVKISRDTFQRENAELKKTVASLQRALKKQVSTD